MDTEKIGRYIAQKRKEKGYTQKDLASLFSITDRAVSKWERGISLPDASIMIDLSKTLGISVNELLSGEDLESAEEYNKKAEEIIIEMKKREEDANEILLRSESILTGSTVALFVLIILTSALIIENEILKIVIIILSLIPLLIAVFYALRIEQKAGYYECPHCHNRYIPSYSAVLKAMHMGRTRYLKCPECNKKGWHKKVTKQRDE